mmetsp:Transcript_9758/g.13793  ORF Transcript_9758/g.13793 Transcript_9758/m.13793 type:complete len:84 (+) Transcript_9758:2019-2270(+)
MEGCHVGVTQGTLTLDSSGLLTDSSKARLQSSIVPQTRCWLIFSPNPYKERSSTYSGESSRDGIISPSYGPQMNPQIIVQGAS